MKNPRNTEKYSNESETWISKHKLATTLITAAVLGTIALSLKEHVQQRPNQPVIIITTAVATQLPAIQTPTQVPIYSHTNTCMVNMIPQTLANSGWINEGSNNETGLQRFRNPFTVAVLEIQEIKLSPKLSTTKTVKVVDHGAIEEEGVTKDGMIRPFVIAENCSRESAEEIANELKNSE